MGDFSAGNLKCVVATLNYVTGIVLKHEKIHDYNIHTENGVWRRRKESGLIGTLIGRMHSLGDNREWERLCYVTLIALGVSRFVREY